MEDLPNFIGFHALVLHGPVEFLFETPPRWIVYSKDPTSDAIAKMHPSKFDLPTAIECKEYMYATIAIHFDKELLIRPDYDYVKFLEVLLMGFFKKIQIFTKFLLKPL